MRSRVLAEVETSEMSTSDAGEGASRGRAKLYKCIVSSQATYHILWCQAVDLLPVVVWPRQARRAGLRSHGVEARSGREVDCGLRRTRWRTEPQTTHRPHLYSRAALRVRHGRARLHRIASLKARSVSH